MHFKNRLLYGLAAITAASMFGGLATAAERQPPPLAVAPFDAAEAKRHQHAWAEYLGVHVEITNSIGMKLMLIPPGEFLMGSPAGDPRGFPTEQPQHRVRISRPFYLGATEVTQQQYERVMGTNPSSFDGAQLPVDNIAWQEAKEFTEQLSTMPGERAHSRSYRLPTEAEWEYSCRAGTMTTWSFGDDQRQLTDHAWYSENYHFFQLLYPVAQKRPNPWGLYDMYGNVAEWVADFRWNYPATPATDPLGTDAGALRVLRGGQSVVSAGGCRSASRSLYRPDYYSPHLLAGNGFRVALNVSQSLGDRDRHQLDPPEPTSRQPRLAVAPFDAAQARRHQEAWGKHLGVKVEVQNSVGMKMVLIPPGEFLMGSPVREADRSSMEPQHRVRITKPYYLGVYEVTQAEYERVMRTEHRSAAFHRNEPFYGVIDLNADVHRPPQLTIKPLREPEGPGRFPVSGMNWEDAAEFCRKLSDLPSERAAGRVYRLPTEAEWEYACRAGTTTVYYFGDSPESLRDYAWYDRNSDGRMHRVGQKKPNPWGLFDMYGNVIEWCSDWLCWDHYVESPLDDPTGPLAGRLRVLRGGSAYGRPKVCRSASRFGDRPDDRLSNPGFRVATSSVEQLGGAE